MSRTKGMDLWFIDKSTVYNFILLVDYYIGDKSLNESLGRYGQTSKTR